MSSSQRQISCAAYHWQISDRRFRSSDALKHRGRRPAICSFSFLFFLVWCLPPLVSPFSLDLRVTWFCVFCVVSSHPVPHSALPLASLSFFVRSFFLFPIILPLFLLLLFLFFFSLSSLPIFWLASARFARRSSRLLASVRFPPLSCVFFNKTKIF